MSLDSQFHSSCTIKQWYIPSMIGCTAGLKDWWASSHTSWQAGRPVTHHPSPASFVTMVESDSEKIGVTLLLGCFRKKNEMSESIGDGQAVEVVAINHLIVDHNWRGVGTIPTVFWIENHGLLDYPLPSFVSQPHAISPNSTDASPDCIIPPD